MVLADDDWEDHNGETERRTLESWGNGLGFVDLLELRSYEEPDLKSFAIWTGDDTTEFETEDEARSALSRFLLDDMRRVDPSL